MREQDSSLVLPWNAFESRSYVVTTPKQQPQTAAAVGPVPKNARKQRLRSASVANSASARSARSVL